MSIEKWNSRRLELTSKTNLTFKEKKELNLLNRCVDFYIQRTMPGYRLSSLKKLLNEIRARGLNGNSSTN
jgi:hypothetical protein